MNREAGPPVALTVAGSDSGAGAGIQADLKAMSALGVFATTAVTAVTAQNTGSVLAVHHLPADLVDAQIGAVVDDLPVAATKTGLLGTAEVVGVVAARARAGQLARLVVDPVLVASSGQRLVTDETVDAYRRELFPRALMITPNLREAAVLAGEEVGSIRDAEGMGALAERLARLGPAWVLVKGGHLPGVESSDPESDPPAVVPDVLFDGTRLTVLTGPRVETANTHGTGCTLSAAVAALLACGLEPGAAVASAKEFVRAALAGSASWRLGRGHGPLDPFGWSTRAPGGTGSPRTTVAGS